MKTARQCLKSLVLTAAPGRRRAVPSLSRKTTGNLSLLPTLDAVSVGSVGPFPLRHHPERPGWWPAPLPWLSEHFPVNTRQTTLLRLTGTRARSQCGVQQAGETQALALKHTYSKGSLPAGKATCRGVKVAHQGLQRRLGSEGHIVFFQRTRV